MATTEKKGFCIMGIAVRTSNDPGAADKDIPALWHKFLSEHIAGSIPGKIGQDIYCVYTDYEKDFTKPYTTVLGCRVDEDTVVPEGFKKVTIPAGKYELFKAAGNIQEGIVFHQWLAIWHLPLKRTYTADFEVYGEKAQNPVRAEVDIFVGIE